MYNVMSPISCEYGKMSHDIRLSQATVCHVTWVLTRRAGRLDIQSMCERMWREIEKQPDNSILTALATWNSICPRNQRNLENLYLLSSHKNLTSSFEVGLFGSKQRIQNYEAMLHKLISFFLLFNQNVLIRIC